MSLFASCLQNLRFDSLSIIAYAHTKLAIIVSNFSLDPTCPRMLKGVSQNLARNQADFVARERTQDFSLTFHCQLEDWCISVRIQRARQFLTCGREPLRQVHLAPPRRARCPEPPLLGPAGAAACCEQPEIEPSIRSDFAARCHGVLARCVSARL